MIKLPPLVELWPHPDRSSTVAKLPVVGVRTCGMSDESLVKQFFDVIYFVSYILHPSII